MCALFALRRDVHCVRYTQVSDACPGVRCDGMHFTSAFDEFECYATVALLFPVLHRHLNETIVPALLRAHGLRQNSTFASRAEAAMHRCRLEPVVNRSALCAGRARAAGGECREKLLPPETSAKQHRFRHGLGW